MGCGESKKSATDIPKRMLPEKYQVVKRNLRRRSRTSAAASARQPVCTSTRCAFLLPSMPNLGVPQRISIGLALADLLAVRAVVLFDWVTQPIC